MANRRIDKQVIDKAHIIWLNDEDRKLQNPEYKKHTIDQILFKLNQTFWDRCISKRKLQQVLHDLKKEIKNSGYIFSNDPSNRRLLPWINSKSHREIDWWDPASNVLLFKLYQEAFTIKETSWAMGLREHFDVTGQFGYVERDHLDKAYYDWLETAREYAQREKYSLMRGNNNDNMITWDLDTFVMMRAWESDSNFEAYKHFIRDIISQRFNEIPD